MCPAGLSLALVSLAAAPECSDLCIHDLCMTLLPSSVIAMAAESPARVLHVTRLGVYSSRVNIHSQTQTTANEAADSTVMWWQTHMQKLTWTHTSISVRTLAVTVLIRWEEEDETRLSVLRDRFEPTLSFLVLQLNLSRVHFPNWDLWGTARGLKS